jgi:hypothetical protein
VDPEEAGLLGGFLQELLVVGLRQQLLELGGLSLIRTFTSQPSS